MYIILKREVYHDDIRVDTSSDSRSLGDYSMLGLDIELYREITLDSFDFLLPDRRADSLYPLRPGQAGIGAL